MAWQWCCSGPGRPAGGRRGRRCRRCPRLDHFALDDGKTTSTWLSQDAWTGRCTRTAFGQAAAVRSMDARPRCEEPLSAIQYTRRAEAYGSAVITWLTRAVNGAIPVVGPAYQVRPVHVVGGQVGDGAVPFVFELDPPGRGRQARVAPGQDLQLGLLVGAEHVLAVFQLSPSQIRWYRSSTRPAFTAKSRSRGKIHDRYRHGRIASASSQRRTVDRATDSTSPSSAACLARSAADHRACGTPRSSGGWQAIALTSATTAAGNTRGRPLRGRSASPPMPP